ncbi:glycoside hydrolase family 95 protein [Flagelloscypha sp. PMI_526]|nr:glycoside hydrolase family 95 protein [Flagelloscypha sp. PMI_526]
MFSKVFLGATAASLVVAGPPSDFPKSGNGLWYDKPGAWWVRTWLPVGNGYTGLLAPGGTTVETTLINLDSLWSGGLFSDPNYNGGNKDPSEREAMAQEMQRIRETIFASSDGSIDSIGNLTSDAGAYGSFAAAGYLVNTLDYTDDDDVPSNYTRWLDMDQALVRTSWTQDSTPLSRTLFCSHPAKACVQHLKSTSPKKKLPSMTFTYSSDLTPGLPAPAVTCFDKTTLQVRGKVEGSVGMLFELLVRVSSVGGQVTCAPNGQNATITVNEGDASEVLAVIVGGTEYDINAGDEAHGFSFKGADPHATLVKTLSGVGNYNTLLKAHLKDVSDTLTSPFSLSLGEVTEASYSSPTDVIRAAYHTDEGNPYLEWLLFNLGRYMLWSSARGTLPTNLLGLWSSGYYAPWSGDYHANINIQMNYWIAELTGFASEFLQPVWDLMQKTWAPRGAITAEVLYNSTRGWVTHNEMNIFGQTGMKKYEEYNTAEWANYPESNVWMMIHVWDHFDFTQDVQWLKSQGYPLLKSVAEFHLDKLIVDDHSGDGTLVTAPCNSPEQPLITFGCAHQQQIIWQLFNSVLRAANIVGEDDSAFLEEVKTKRAQMDKGLHIGSWGQIQEWKVEHDNPDDTHRHLSHLIGLYPGYAISSYDSTVQGNYTRDQVLAAASISLTHRGNGTGPDADAGWGKVWRAAGWAQLGDASKFYHQLTYALERDFCENLWSAYDPLDDEPIFQIDANLGYPAALLNALVQVPDVPSDESPLIVTLLPALPQQWSSGSVKGVRIRGGYSLDLEWSSGTATKARLATTSGARSASKKVQLWYRGKQVEEFGPANGEKVVTAF